MKPVADPIQSVWFVRKSNLRIGGVEMQIIRQARWFNQNLGISCVLVTNDPGSDFAALFKAEQFRVYVCPLDGPGYFLPAIRTLRSLLQGQRGVVLQAHMFRESMVCRIVNWFVPDLVHYFRVETYIDCSPIPNRRKRIYHLAARCTRGLVDRYFANGDLVAGELKNRSGVPASRITTAFNGVEAFGDPDPSPVAKDDDGCIRLAFVANLIPGKGHDLLFRAMAQINHPVPRFRVFLFGDDLYKTGAVSFRAMLERKSIELDIEDQVRFCGFQHDLLDALQSIHIVVLPSDTEGTPNCILEAMSAEKLVVVSDAGELPYIVDRGEAGLLHGRGNLNELTAALLRVINTPVEQLGEIRKNGYTRWKTHFSMDAAMHIIQPFYQRNRIDD